MRPKAHFTHALASHGRSDHSWTAGEPCHDAERQPADTTSMSSSSDALSAVTAIISCQKIQQVVPNPPARHCSAPPPSFLHTEISARNGAHSHPS